MERDAVGVTRGDTRFRGDDAAMEDVRMVEISAFARAVRSESIAATLYDKEKDHKKLANSCWALKLKRAQSYQMFRYQILIEYEGTNFRGWQIQKKGKTVQGLLQEKISKLLKEKIIIYGAGRLDVGVHAKEQSAHFDCKNKITDVKKFLKSINHFLLKME